MRATIFAPFQDAPNQSHQAERQAEQGDEGDGGQNVGGYVDFGPRCGRGGIVGIFYHDVSEYGF